LVNFSRRTAWDVAESDVARAVREARASGLGLVDLTVSNPTVCGFRYDAAAILGPLGGVGALRYEADPRGARAARAAVARYYGDHGAEVDADAVMLTTSTSEGYGWLFKLLCDAGDEVLIARPSYPLFDFLAELEDVRIASYPLFYDYGWWIDFAELERRIGPRTRAVVVVHPNNPTGHATGLVERGRMEEMCARHGLALIVDEVFLDYPLSGGSVLDGSVLDGERAMRSFAVGPHPVPTFVLSGMSKVAGLPQMKAAWIAVFGPEGERREALQRMEVIGDTYLSMNAPVQGALPFWMEGRGGIQGQIRERVRANLEVLRAAGVEVLRADGGWSAVVRVPRIWGEGTVFARLLELGVVVQPGELYGMAEGNRVVVSLLVPVEAMRVGARALRMG